MIGAEQKELTEDPEVEKDKTDLIIVGVYGIVETDKDDRTKSEFNLRMLPIWTIHKSIDTVGLRESLLF